MTTEYQEILKNIVQVWETCSNDEWDKYYPVHDGNHPAFISALKGIKEIQYANGPIKYGNVRDKAQLPKIEWGKYALHENHVWGYVVTFDDFQIFRLGF